MPWTTHRATAHSASSVAKSSMAPRADTHKTPSTYSTRVSAGACASAVRVSGLAMAATVSSSSGGSKRKSCPLSPGETSSSQTARERSGSRATTTVSIAATQDEPSLVLRSSRCW